MVGEPVFPRPPLRPDRGPVAAQLAAASTSLAKTILGNANEVAAALCASDGAQPAAVCGSAGVTAAAALLPKAST